MNLIRDQRFIAPNGLAVSAPETVKRPARQLFARIPFALSKVNKALFAVALTQSMIEIRGEPAFGRAKRSGVPLFAVGIVHGNESRLAAHRESHVIIRKPRVDCATEA